MENIKSYLDGELDLAQQTEVETHLRNDLDLQRMADEFRSISDSLQTADAGEPYGFEKLEARLAQASNERRVADKKIWRIATWSSLGMACLVLVVMVPMFAQSKSSASDAYAESKVAATASAATLPNQDYSPPAVSAPSGQPQEEAKAKFDLREQQLSNGAAQVDGLTPDRLRANPTPPVALGRPPSGTPEVADKIDSGTFRDGGGNAGFAPPAMAKTPQTSSARKSETEGDFKSNMRSIRDQQARNPSTLNDTPHGIYLERSGQVQIKVDDLMRSVDEATGMVQSLDGFVVNHDLQNEADGGISTMTLRVPTKNFNAAMNKLQAMGEVISVNSSSQDITTETVDNGSRMITWADEEKRLMNELANAKTENEKWRIRQQLANVRANLESYRAVVKSLKDRSEYSTINVTFLRGDKADKAAPGSTNWSGTAFKDAKSGLGSVGQVLGVILIYAGVFTPIWLPFLIAFLVIRKRNQ